MATVFERVQSIAVERLGVDEAKVKPDSSFIDDLGADSLDLVEMVMELEEKFGLEIPDEAANNIKTVQDAVDYLKSRGIKDEE